MARILNSEIPGAAPEEFEVQKKRLDPQVAELRQLMTDEGAEAAATPKPVGRRRPDAKPGLLAVKSLIAAFSFLALTGFAGKTPVFFPPGAFGETPVASATRERASGFLKSLHEPSLWELSQKDNKAEVYRFFLLSSAEHPVTVRLVMQSGRTYSRRGWGSGEGKPQGRKDYSLVFGRKDAVQGFANEMNNADFWNLTTTPCVDENAHWILEGVKAGKYHVVDRCSPGDTDPLRKIGILALKLSGLP
ncbi:MAG: hypothetical protein WBY44_15090 [Bryobacteraceae bacterium]